MSINLNLTFPPTPENASKEIIKPSKQFNREVFSMLNALAIFVITYLLLFLSAIVIACAFVALGFGIVILKASFITLVLGVGLAAAGAMLVFFLIKFLFVKPLQRDTSGLIEITEEEQPRLFEFINRLTSEVGVSKPRKIFLTHDVNASVFYDSTFRSMFLPTQKNLIIGLGIVNAVNKSEFKAILAHEFGHFSQRSMKFGSYVYNLNKILHNLLYDNEGFEKALNSWARIHSILRLTAHINIFLIKGIQAILRKVYIMINKTHLRLSREMEFQADAISAYVSGSNQSVSLLRRSELADLAFSKVLNFWNEKVTENLRSENFYEQQRQVMRDIADEYRLQLDQAGIPIVDKQLSILNNSKVSIDDQWASHPTSIEREQRLNALNIPAITVYKPAWELFENPVALQEEFTNGLYRDVDSENKLTKISEQAYEDIYFAEKNRYAYPEAYRGYYNNRSIAVFDLSSDGNSLSTYTSITDIFTDDNINLPRRITGMQHDIELLNKVISDDNITFDYEGIKYHSSYAPDIAQIIKKEIRKTEEAIEKLDKAIYAYFYNQANQQQKKELNKRYAELFNLQQSTAADYALYDKIQEELRPLYAGLNRAEIQPTVGRMQSTEADIKQRIEQLLHEDTFEKVLNEDQVKVLTDFLATNLTYFETSFNQTAFTILGNVLDIYIYGLVERHYLSKKQLLELQLIIVQ